MVLYLLGHGRGINMPRKLYNSGAKFYVHLICVFILVFLYLSLQLNSGRKYERASLMRTVIKE